ncbi:MAG: alpha-xylosidase [Streptosporangiales bacterium]|nr:alpha-xylosidase [Streptosporangiales bacterium]
MSHLLREVTEVHTTTDGLVLGVRAVPCAQLPGGPGYLTGEPPQVQGIETTLPNLPPELDLPTGDERAYEIRVRWAAPGTVRLTIAPPDAWPHADDGTRLGIVTDAAPQPSDVTVEERDGWVEAASAQLRVRVRRQSLAVEVVDVATGEVLLRTADRLRQVAGFPMAPAVLATDDDATTVHFELAADEDAYGTGTGMAYKPVPVWHSTRGYLGFLNTGAQVVADVGHSRPSVLALTVPDTAVDLYVVAAATPKERLSAYTALTGRGPVPPLWAYGGWLGRCRYHSRAELEEVGQGLRKHQVPCDVIHLDPDWLVLDRLNTDFVWNTERFGNRRELVEALDALGLRLSVWELPYLDPRSHRYAEAERLGYLVTDADGEPARVTKTLTPDGLPRGLVDFTNPAAREWWQSMHEAFLDDGVAVFKTDFGEGLPDDAVSYDGTPPNHAHNLYPLRYNGAVSEVIGRHTGRSPLVFGRSGWAGSQRYPGQWGGDAESTVAGMQASLRGGLSYALSAPGVWSHDVGGFYGPELTPELFVRWTQFGALSPMMRAHGLRPREPWAFGDEALAIVRDWIRLRYALLPYLWQVAHESAAGGWPMLRPLGLEFPDDPVAVRTDDAFLLGADLLAAPIFDDRPGTVQRRFYLPAGTWRDWFTGETFTGPGFHTVEVSLERMPVLVRTGAVIPVVEVDDGVRRTDDLIGRPWQLCVHDAEPVARELVGFDGSVTSVQVAGGQVTAAGSQPIAAAVQPW